MTTLKITRRYAAAIGAAVTGLAVLLPAAQAQAGTPPVKTVLGHLNFHGHYGRGWGHVHPKQIFNGGDPSGDVTHIFWNRWGTGSSTGWGHNYIFKPGGGYYPDPVEIELRARNVHPCAGHRTYTHLYVRVPSKPGGPLGRWQPWTPHDTDLCSASTT